MICSTFISNLSVSESKADNESFADFNSAFGNTGEECFFICILLLYFVSIEVEILFSIINVSHIN